MSLYILECWSHLDPALWPIGENALPSLRVRIHPKHHGYSTQSHSALLSHETSLIAPRFFATPQTVARQAPGSMGFSRQEYWGGVPCPPPGDCPNPGMEPASPGFPTMTGMFFTTETRMKPRDNCKSPSSQEDQNIICRKGPFLRSTSPYL